MLSAIGVLLIAVSFAIFSIYVAKLLHRVAQSIESLGNVANRMEGQVNETAGAVEQTLEEADWTIRDIDVKLEALDSVFDTVEEVGETAYLTSTGLKEATGVYAKSEVMPGTKPFVRVVQFSELTLGMVDSWKRGKQATY
ncbi:DUF948 domain-containing protein [Sporosarcina sp. 179-K 3D1 HS]|uniref:DUF948 domain-containing protein n=1 Tax=Sporosarcina sp. 179-K 3D1 HS TaxID=3232169 RepID=UPI00399FCB76